MEVRDENPVVASTEEWRQKMAEKSAVKGPSFFHLRAQLPKQGRTNIVLGATSTMSVVLKTYASGGENELHAHPNEDHVFLILQGGANFHGPNGEMRQVAKNDCVLLPRGTFYWFQAIEGEPLVMVRIGSVLDPSLDPLARIDIEGKPFGGYSEANKEVPVLLGDKWFE
jgi:mannose-6-phosphate isomerase-like protein (cupin superfamily)